MSERSLFRYLSKSIGLTPAQLIKELRLRKAYHILTKGKSSSTKEVAMTVGFENAGYFSKEFFKRFGKRPTEYKN
jgi:transcriptional regulator GlxA family with amidase domain